MPPTARLPQWPQPLVYPVLRFASPVRPIRLGQAVEAVSAAVSTARTGAGFTTGSYGFSSTGQALSTTGALVGTAGTLTTLATTLMATAAIPYVGWVAAAVGAALMVAGSLFGGKPGVYDAKRAQASQTGSAELAALGGILQTAGQKFLATRNLADALAGLQTQFDARNPVRSWLKLPNDVAAIVLGTTPSGNYGTATQVDWSSMTPGQFGRLLTAMAKDPSLIDTSVQGSGDVAYLPQAQAEALAASVAAQSRQYLHALVTATTAGPEAAAVTTWIGQTYQQLLGRPPSASEVSAALDPLIAQQLTPQQFVQSMLLLPEFRARVAATPTAATTYWWQPAFAPPEPPVMAAMLPSAGILGWAGQHPYWALSLGALGVGLLVRIAGVGRGRRRR